MRQHFCNMLATEGHEMIEPETSLIRDQLIKLNQIGFLTLSSQPGSIEHNTATSFPYEFTESFGATFPDPDNLPGCYLFGTSIYLLSTESDRIRLYTERDR